MAARTASLRHTPFLTRAIEAHLAQDAFAAGDVAQGQRWLQQMAARESLGDKGLAAEAASHQVATEQFVAELRDSLTDPEQRRSFRATPTGQALFAD